MKLVLTAEWVLHCHHYLVNYWRIYTILWVIMLCSQIGVHWCFRGTCCHHLQGQRVSQTSKKQAAIFWSFKTNLAIYFWVFLHLSVLWDYINMLMLAVYYLVLYLHKNYKSYIRTDKLC
jgi:hypothetical protein